MAFITLLVATIILQLLTVHFAILSAHDCLLILSTHWDADAK